MDNDLLEPLSLFNKTLKKEFHKNAEEYFEELAKKAEIDVDANKKTVASYKKALSDLEHAKKQANKTRTWKAVIIFLIVIMFIVAGVFVYFAINNQLLDVYLNILIAVLCVGVAVGFIIFLVKKINKKIQKQQEKCDQLAEQANRFLAEANAQMLGLNKLFDWNTHIEIIRRTTDLLQMDPYFDIRRFQYLHDKYDLDDEVDPKISTDFIISGVIAKNPFLIVRQLNQTMENKTYYGTLVISWVETYHDSEGHLHTTTRSQTLHASVIKPAPFYDYKTFLVYGNDAAPDLSFTRSPSNASGLSEKEIQRKVKKGEKELQKRSEKGVTDGGFTRLSNSEFDILFGALDRNNEVQFRLLFTPLAQKSLLELIKSNTPYGDDFTFIKNGPLNFIISRHSQNQNYYGNPSNYMSYDLESAKKQFVSYNDSWIQSVYFDLAPLLSIPLYQQHEGDSDYVYTNTYDRNYTSYEEEVLANAFDPSLFKHPDSVTPTTLKANFVAKCNDADLISVVAYSFAGINRVDYVPVRGGDGHTHNVPVNWVEYVPLECETLMVMKAFDGSKADFDNLQENAEFQGFLGKYSKDCHVIFQRGLMALLVTTLYNNEIDNELTNIIKKCRIN